jgi:PAS domain S-box-containing protein
MAFMERISGLDLKQKLAFSLEYIPSGAFLIDTKGKIELVNAMFSKLLGYRPGEVTGHNLRKFIPAEVLESDSGHLLAFVQGGIERTTELEMRFIHKQQHPVWTHVSLKLIYDEESRSFWGFGVITDLTKQKETERELIRVSKRQETLLKESQQRLKNSLTTLGGLFNLQLTYVTDPEAIVIVKAALERIQALLLLSSTLHDSENASGVNLCVYMHELIHYYYRHLPDNQKNIRLRLDIDAIVLDEVTANTIGLLVNELLANYFRDSSANFEQSQLDIQLKREGQTDLYKLIVQSSGVHANPFSGKTFSDPNESQILKALVKELNGSIRISRQTSQEVAVEVRFSDLQKHLIH